MSTGEAGPAGREGQPGPAGREGAAGRTGPIGHEGVAGIEGPAGPPGPIGAIVDLTTAQEDLAVAVRLLYGGVRRLIALVAACLIAILVFGAVHLRLSTVIREEGLASRQSFKCIVAVLFRQDPPACPEARVQLEREGILPTTTTTTTTAP